MSFSDIYKNFDESRPDLRPYGMTCEVWTPKPMPRPDRHNEIEINFFPQGSLSYLVNDRVVKIPAKRLAVFWALAPHQIVEAKEDYPYFVCTIPFVQFMEWRLPKVLLDRLFSGEVLISDSIDFWKQDAFMFKNWIEDINSSKREQIEVALSEIKARLHRFSQSSISTKDPDHVLNDVSNMPIRLVEKMAIFIAANYAKPIKISAVAEAAGLHPDYANNIFKKTFGSTLSSYIREQRVLHAQRMLMVTQKTITQIAFESGFNSIGRFNIAFKKLTRYTPREYRKLYLN